MGPGASPGSQDEDPAAKRQKLGSLDSLGLDFAALQRTGLLGGDDEEAERSAAKAALQSTFSSLQQDVKKDEPDKRPEEEENVGRKKKAENVDFGCDLPPDSIEIFDEYEWKYPDGVGAGTSEEPWSTFDLADAGLTPSIVSVMRKAGFDAPTPIQAETWPILSAGRDLIGVAKTGSGKTLAFLLPCFAQLLKDGLRARTEGSLPVQMTKSAALAGAYSPEVLVLAPSRELADQIECEAKKFTPATGIKTLAVFGGTGTRSEQLGALRERPECVVATLGRLCDFLDCESEWFGVKTVKFLILDEADALLGENLSDNIRNITTDVETVGRQTMLFSATFDDEVRKLASWILKYPVEVRVGMRDPLKANSAVDQQIMIVKDDVDKEGALKNLIRKQYSQSVDNQGKLLIFASDHCECDFLMKKITAQLVGAKVDTLHGNKTQDARENAIAAFRSGEIPVLIATSVAGRGLDVKDVKLVINYDPPEDALDYVHRIGRTGRAGNKGTAITLLRKGPDGKAMIYITHVMRRTGKNVPKDLIDALKQRRGRDMTDAAEALKGICGQVNVVRGWQGNRA